MEHDTSSSSPLSTLADQPQPPATLDKLVPALKKVRAEALTLLRCKRAIQTIRILPLPLQEWACQKLDQACDAMIEMESRWLSIKNYQHRESVLSPHRPRRLSFHNEVTVSEFSKGSPSTSICTKWNEDDKNFDLRAEEMYQMRKNAERKEVEQLAFAREQIWKILHRELELLWVEQPDLNENDMDVLEWFMNEVANMEKMPDDCRETVRNVVHTLLQYLHEEN